MARSMADNSSCLRTGLPSQITFPSIRPTVRKTQSIGLKIESSVHSQVIVASEIGVVHGSVERDDTRYVVEEGSVVEMIVTTDAADRVHVHGYEILAMVNPDDPAEIVFTADSAGVFEVELEDSGLFLFDLQVG